jgi:hypothetical protein
MVDWMVEVLTNFKCADQTFFLAVSLLDRYFNATPKVLEVNELHCLGVTAMFIASKFEDIHPLKMKMVHEKIGHRKIPVEKIKAIELEFLQAIHYKIAAPSVLDFVKYYLRAVLQIENIEEDCKDPKALVYKMSIYLCKMAVHDYQLSGQVPSLVAIGCLYVALKICEQLSKERFITVELVQKIVEVSRHEEADTMAVSKKVLYLAQNFDKELPGLENLKKTHFAQI